MKKLGLVFKETSEKLIKNRLKESESVLIIKYSGLSSPDLSSLRLSLKNTKAKLFVVKNSVARRALKDSGRDSVLKSIEGPCGFVFTADEIADTSKILYNFAKDHEHLKLEGGFLKDRILEKKDIETLAKLPSKEMLRALAVTAIKSPISGLVITLNQVIRKFVYCLDQIKQKKTG